MVTETTMSKPANGKSKDNFFPKSTNPNSGMNKQVDLATLKGKGSYKAVPPKSSI